MRHKRLQFAVAILMAAGCVGTASAQKQHLDRPPQQSSPAPTHAPTQNQNQTHNANRPPSNENHPSAGTNSGNAGQSHIAPPASYSDRPPDAVNPNLRSRQQMGIGSPRPWVDTMRGLSPAERERVLQNSRAFQNLSPDKQNRIRQQFNQWDHMTPTQQADLRAKERTWRDLTPNQRDYIKNQVLPRWRQMPWDRQQMMKQKLSVLQNMPESARNQRLNDPNFTRGMTDEEKSMLHDLSHTHVGSAPEPPSE